MTSTDIRQRTRSFLMENFLYMRPDFELRDRDSLLGNGIIDSLGVMELLAFIEQQFGVRPEDDEITEHNFGTVDAIVDFVVEKRRAAVSAS